MELKEVDFVNARLVPPAEAQKAAISVVGLGYVGAVSTACLAWLGHQVIGVDVDQAKVDQVAAGHSPIHEEGLGERLADGVARGRISATNDLSAAVRETDVTFISVGTPTAADGGCDYSHIEKAARAMAVGLRQKSGFHVFAMRCSIPPGTTMQVMVPILEELSGKTAGRDFGVCFNPEFLREGVAIDDFHNPPKTVIGTLDMRAAEVMSQIIAPVDSDPIITTIEAAEMVKYVDNVWHATKVCFANEVGRLCKPIGVDSHDVMNIFVRDQKLNLSSYYLKPGFAYGGSCLPKEVRAVQHIAREIGVDLPLIGNLDQSNQEHIAQAIRMVRETDAKRVGILGLAFKPGTDDLRESPILDVMASLWADGVELYAHDTAITPGSPLKEMASYMRHGNPGFGPLNEAVAEMLHFDVDEVVSRADAIVVCHNNALYREVVQRVSGKPVIDLVRLFREQPAGTQVNGIGW